MRTVIPAVAALGTLLALALVLASPVAARPLPGQAAAQSPTGPAAARQDGERPAELLTIADPRIGEASGLAPSRRHQGVLYTHNDSGDRPRVFAIGPDGRTLATLTLRGASARDWEAIAPGRDDRGRPALFVGDIGDNLGGAWPSITVYRVTEPATLRDATLPATRYRLRYADGPRDAEALLVDPRSNRLYVASKEGDGGGLYRAPARLRTDRVNLLRKVAAVPPAVTDGAFSPDGSAFVLRDYDDAHIYAAPGKRLGSVRLPLQFQGESIAYDGDGASLLAGSEGAASQVWRVPLPAALVRAPDQPGKSGREPASKAGRGDPEPGAGPGLPRLGLGLGSGWGWGAGLALLVGGAAALLGAGRRRRRWSVTSTGARSPRRR